MAKKGPKAAPIPVEELREAARALLALAAIEETSRGEEWWTEAASERLGDEPNADGAKRAEVLRKVADLVLPLSRARRGVLLRSSLLLYKHHLEGHLRRRFAAAQKDLGALDSEIKALDPAFDPLRDVPAESGTSKRAAHWVRVRRLVGAWLFTRLSRPLWLRSQVTGGDVARAFSEPLVVDAMMASRYEQMAHLILGALPNDVGARRSEGTMRKVRSGTALGRRAIDSGALGAYYARVIHDDDDGLSLDDVIATKAKN